MITNMPKERLSELLERQLNNFFICDNCYDTIYYVMNNVLDRVGKSFSAVSNKYYSKDGNTYFSTNHSEQYAIFLYYLSNELFKQSQIERDDNKFVLAEQVYYLNKIMHGVNFFYAINLPEHFCVEHPIGSILGRAEYGDYLLIYQGVTIGGSYDKDGKIEYPKLGKNVTCFANSSILGNSKIGDNVIIGANTQIVNRNIPNNVQVIYKDGHVIIKPNEFKTKFWK